MALHWVKSTPWLPEVEALRHSNQKTLNDAQETTYQIESKEQQFGNPLKTQRDIMSSPLTSTSLLNTLKIDAFGVISTMITAFEPGTLFDQLP